ncbi:polysaccharide pyruvyl transferase family protein [Microbacterium sp. NPDC078428]|uniref:polysaccharide pyruvyl transferase family protein n=1 Tax=Microbacterium sp. NPDC078428 TaxID=3364190 RepID=UPI0037C53FED
MRVIAIGDIGVTDGMMHIGDEAMFGALVDELRARGVEEITALSAAPAETAARYGVDAMPRIGFPAGRSEGAARFAAVRAAISGDRPFPDDPFWSVRDAVSGADAVVVAGGGNMASTWPLHIFERAALALLARAAGIPFVVTGQTLGPHLSDDDRAVLAGALGSARLVGLRESASGRLARDLGIPAERSAVTLDDASFLGWEEPAQDAAASEDLTLVSLSTHLGGRDRDAVVRGLAAGLDDLADATGRPTLFHAHWGSLRPGDVRGDAVLHEAVRERMRTPSRSTPTGDSRSAAALARRASLLVSSRYHPVVFAAPAGVPVVALTADDYTTVKLTGALAPWGQHRVVDLDAAASGSLSRPLRAADASRAETRRTAEARRPAARDAAVAWWDRVAAAAGAR